MNMLLPKQNLKNFPKKIEQIKKLPCMTPNWFGHECCERIDPAHYRFGLYLGANIKDDRYINPLCRIHHTIQGDKGELDFWGERILDAKVTALLLHIHHLEGNEQAMRFEVERF